MRRPETPFVEQDSAEYTARSTQQGHHLLRPCQAATNGDPILLTPFFSSVGSDPVDLRLRPGGAFAPSGTV